MCATRSITPSLPRRPAIGRRPNPSGWTPTPPSIPRSRSRVLPRNPAAGDPHRAQLHRRRSDGEPGIKALIDRAAPIDELTAAYERALKNMDECVAILKVSISPATVGFTAFTVIAREGLEAIIVLAALLAGMRGVEHQGTRRWVSSGAWLAIVASAITFWLSKTLIQSLSRYGEKLEAVVSILAVIILLMVTNWVFHKFYWVGWNAKLRSLSKASQKAVSDRWEWLALLGVGFLTVYREGFETTLFMQSLLLEGSVWPVVIGVLAGTAVHHRDRPRDFQIRRKASLPEAARRHRRAGRFHHGHFLRLDRAAVPDRRLAADPSDPGLTIPTWAGLWLGLYPSWEGLLIPPLALVYVGGAWLWVKFSSRQAAKAAKAAPSPQHIRISEPAPEAIAADRRQGTTD